MSWAIPHHDGTLGACLSDDEPLEEVAPDALPAAPGVLALASGDGPGRIVWASETSSLREGAENILGKIRTGRTALRLRYAIVPDREARTTLALRIEARIVSAPPPGLT